MIFITNTLSGKKEKFIPLFDSKVTLYVCGITPYDYAHLGHGRVYVTFDLFFRLLQFLKYEVTYCRNFTDIDDKILNRAQKELDDKKKYLEISQKFIDAFHEDMAKLNCIPPTFEPRVTQTIPEIITFIKGLVEKGTAYEVDGDVYFEISKFPAYGKLSKHKLQDLHAGARVEIDNRKKSPLDFALWKKSESQEPGWQSPWGIGRPGWHIECSAMAEKFLGKTIDVHAGGMDLIFPHHENEIAQSEGLYDFPFVRYWMHNGFVRINQEKMSKSLGNFFTLKDIFEKYDPMVVRFYLLNHQYKAPLDFSFDDLDMMQKSYQRVCRIFESLPEKNLNELDILKSNTVEKMLDFLIDDLNTPGMFGIFFESLQSLQQNQEELQRVKGFFQQILGLSLKPLIQKEVVLTPEIEQLLAEREQARKEKNWKKADELREKLKELGYETQDQKIK
jgi:cysteinyl-tRNA synthetase